ncbi:hypothetical protein PsYK624_135370 [Phanerochaete sordida]|uniref:Uncharacterized protein n=1 Tax=Phanerochaete sordida TaxID=48140 RepID=A0A9P3GM73_9APHY|nr:hypothetical protein PsYK624_135370 [Phanerochaete sordida]
MRFKTFFSLLGLTGGAAVDARQASLRKVEARRLPQDCVLSAYRADQKKGDQFARGGEVLLLVN